jgi:acyl carrier protein
MNARLKVIQEFEQVAREQERALPELTDDLALFDSGLDSLCFAIIVTRLEDSLGVDPFAADTALFPATFGEFVQLYETAVEEPSA